MTALGVGFFSLVALMYAAFERAVLHAQTAVALRMALFDEPGIVITSVPYKLGDEA